MYLEFIDTPTDKNVQKYPSVYLTSPHEWDPSALDYVQPDGNGKTSWSTDLIDRSQYDPNCDELGDYVKSTIQNLTILDDKLKPSSAHNMCANKHALTHTSTDYEKLRPCSGWVITGYP